MKRLLLIAIAFFYLTASAQIPSGGYYIQDCSFTNGVYRFVVFPSGPAPGFRDIGQDGDPEFIYIHQINYSTSSGPVQLGSRSAKLFFSFASKSGFYDSIVVTISDAHTKLTNVVLQFASDQGQSPLCPVNDANCNANNEWGTSGNWVINYSMCSLGLPITLNYFDVQKTGSGITASWQTANEQNSNYFLLQGSVDGENWITLDSVGSKATLGNSDTPLTYSVTISESKLMIAGIGYICLLVLFAASITDFKLVRRLMFIIMIMFAGWSCKKSVNNISTPTIEIKFIRLMHYDFDGSTYVSPVKFLE